MVSELPLKGITLLLGNDLAHEQEVVTPLLSPYLCWFVKTKVLEECPEGFPVCIVIHLQTKSNTDTTTNVDNDAAAKTLIVEFSRLEVPPPVDLADTVYARWCGVDQLPVLSQDTLTAEQKKEPHSEPYQGDCSYH